MSEHRFILPLDTPEGSVWRIIQDAIAAGNLLPDKAGEVIAEFVATKAKAAKAGGAGRLTFRVSDKGGVSVYGLQRMPVTLYRTQWSRLLAPETVKALGEFIASNASLLHDKPANGNGSAKVASPAALALA
jgi:hypothetical protein